VDFQGKVKGSSLDGTGVNPTDDDGGDERRVIIAFF
jgi:hypothetical protein